MTKTKPEEFDMLEAMRPMFEKQMELAKRIDEEQPSLGYVTAFVIAGDLVHAERIEEMFQRKEVTFSKAWKLMGSYARFDWVVRQLEAGKVKPAQVYKILPHLWTGSDPDDTDPRYLALWKRAYEANGNKPITDGKALPRKRELTIYRGQDRGQEKIGIAWSLDRDIAASFARGAWARQGNRDGVVLEATVDRRDVIAYITGRNEEEIIVDPANLNYE